MNNCKLKFSIAWSVLAAMIANSPGVLPAVEPIPETQPVAIQTTFPQVCPKYKWMTWPTYESWYSLYHPSDCLTNQAVSFDTPLGTTFLNCPNCIPAKIVSTAEDQQSGNLELVQFKEDGVEKTGGNKTKPTHKPGTKLTEKLPNVKIKKLDEDVAEPKYKLNKQATTHDYVTFFVNDAAGEKVQIFAVLRHIRLERRKNATGDLTHYPPVMQFNVGQEVSEDATEDNSARDPEFTPLPPGAVEMLDGNVLNVSLVGATFQVVTSTEVSGIPADE